MNPRANRTDTAAAHEESTITRIPASVRSTTKAQAARELGASLGVIHPIRAGLAIDDLLTGWALRHAFARDNRLLVVAQHTGVGAATNVLQRACPDVVVIAVPAMTAEDLAAIEQLATALERTKLLLLTSVRDERTIIRAIEAGASDWLPGD